MSDERWQAYYGGDDPDQELAESLMRAVDAELDEGSSYMDMMYAAYCRETDIPPDRVAMVQQKNPDTGTTLTFFIDRDDMLRELGM